MWKWNVPISNHSYCPGGIAAQHRGFSWLVLKSIVLLWTIDVTTYVAQKAGYYSKRTPLTRCERLPRISLAGYTMTAKLYSPVYK